MKSFLLVFVILLVSFCGEAQKVDTSLYTSVYKKPKFEGGIEAIYQFFAKNVQIPEELISKQLECQIAFSFTIEKDGSLSNFHAMPLKEPCAMCENEVIRIAKILPKWQAGADEKGNY
jgi:hypothetical protein